MIWEVLVVRIEEIAKSMYDTGEEEQVLEGNSRQMAEAGELERRNDDDRKVVDMGSISGWHEEIARSI